MLNFRRSFWTVRNHAASPERMNERQTVKFLQQLKTAAGNARQKFALALLAALVALSPSDASAQAATPVEQAQGLITTATTTFGNVVTFVLLVTGFSIIMWVVLKIRKAK